MRTALSFLKTTLSLPRFCTPSCRSPSATPRPARVWLSEGPSLGAGLRRRTLGALQLSLGNTAPPRRSMAVSHGRLQLRKVRHRSVFVLAFLVGRRKSAVVKLVVWVRRAPGSCARCVSAAGATNSRCITMVCCCAAVCRRRAGTQQTPAQQHGRDAAGWPRLPLRRTGGNAMLSLRARARAATAPRRRAAQLRARRLHLRRLRLCNCARHACWCAGVAMQHGGGGEMSHFPRGRGLRGQGSPARAFFARLSGGPRPATEGVGRV
jgi:hypothetical protein